MFGSLGGPELFLIMVVALIVFGPRKLPEIGKSLGKMMAEFRKASNDFRRTVEEEVEADKMREAARLEAPAVATTTSPAEPSVTAAAGSEPPVTAEPVADPGSATPAADPAASVSRETEVGEPVSIEPK